MSAYDLTTVANVKAWLGLPLSPTPSDATARRAGHRGEPRDLCGAEPDFVASAELHRHDRPRERPRLPRNWPVQQVNSVMLDGLAVPPAMPAGAPPTLGYLLQPGDGAPPGRPQALDIFGRRHHRRRQSLIVAYQAGYADRGRSADRALGRALSCSPPRRLSAPGPAISASSMPAPDCALQPVSAAPGGGAIRRQPPASTDSTRRMPARRSRCPTATCRRTWRRRRRTRRRALSRRRAHRAALQIDRRPGDDRLRSSPAMSGAGAGADCSPIGARRSDAGDSLDGVDALDRRLAGLPAAVAARSSKPRRAISPRRWPTRCATKSCRDRCSTPSRRAEGLDRGGGDLDDGDA